MLASGAPLKFPVPFANGASPSYVRIIPVASQIGIQNGAASFTDGFPPNTFSAIASGGQPPFGQDLNGVLNEITAWDRWAQAGGPVNWDSSFATAIGGYPNGARVGSNILAGGLWMSTIDNNLSNPDAFGANWIWDPGRWSTGMLQSALFTVPPPVGWVSARSSYTIGNAASGANYAAADAVFIFVWLWTTFPNTQCAVSGGRGASGLADFNAGKTIATLDVSGTGFIGADNSTGRLSGVPVISGGIGTVGGIIGENFHQLTPGEIAYHYHSGSGTSGYMTASNPHSHGVNGGIYGGTTTIGRAQTQVNDSFSPLVTTAIGINSVDINHQHSYSFNTDSGNTGNGSHNTVDRKVVGNWFLKL